MVASILTENLVNEYPGSVKSEKGIFHFHNAYRSSSHTRPLTLLPRNWGTEMNQMMKSHISGTLQLDMRVKARPHERAKLRAASTRGNKVRRAASTVVFRHEISQLGKQSSLSREQLFGMISRARQLASKAGCSTSFARTYSLSVLSSLLCTLNWIIQLYWHFLSTLHSIDTLDGGL